MAQDRVFFKFLTFSLVFFNCWSVPSFAANPKLDGHVNSISHSVDTMIAGLKRIDSASPKAKKKASPDSNSFGAGNVAEGGGGSCGVGADVVATNFRDSGILKELEDSKGELRKIVSEDGKKIAELGESFKAKKQDRSQFKENFLDPVNQQVTTSLHDVLYKEAKAAALLKGVNEGSAKGKVFFANFYGKWKLGRIPDPAAVKSYYKEVSASQTQHKAIVNDHLCNAAFMAKAVCNKACEGYKSFHSELTKLVSDKFPALRAAMKEQVAMAEMQESVLVASQDKPVESIGGQVPLVAGAPPSDITGTLPKEKVETSKVVASQPVSKDSLDPKPVPKDSHQASNENADHPVKGALETAKLERDLSAEPQSFYAAEGPLLPGNDNPVTTSDLIAASNLEATKPFAPTIINPTENIEANEVTDPGQPVVGQEDVGAGWVTTTKPAVSGETLMATRNLANATYTDPGSANRDPVLAKYTIDFNSQKDSKAMQNAINEVLAKQGQTALTVDGKFGPSSKQALDSIMSDEARKQELYKALQKDSVWAR